MLTSRTASRAAALTSAGRASSSDLWRIPPCPKAWTGPLPGTSRAARSAGHKRHEQAVTPSPLSYPPSLPFDRLTGTPCPHAQAAACEAGNGRSRGRTMTYYERPRPQPQFPQVALLVLLLFLVLLLIVPGF